MSSAIEAGKAFVSLGVKSSLDKDLRKSKATLKKFAKVSAKLMAGAAAAAFGVATAALVKLTNEAKEIRKLSSEIGVSTQELQKLGHASRRVGLDIEDMVGAIEEFRIRVAEAAQDGTGPLADMFNKLGLDAKEFINLPITEALARIADELNSLDAASRQFAADEIFGGDGRRMLKFFELGADGIYRMSQEAVDLGLVFSKETMDGLENINHAFQDMELLFDSIVGNMANAWASELEYMVAFARLVSEDIGLIFDSVSGSIISSLAESIKWWFEQEGFTNEADFLNNIIEDNEARQKEHGRRMADIVEQQRRRREERENNRNGRGGGKKGRKTGSAPGTTVPTPWEMYQQENPYAAAMFDENLGAGKPEIYSRDVSSSAIGGFVGVSGIGQERTKMVKVNEQQLEEQKKTNDKLDEMMNISNANGNPTIWTGGN